MQFIPLCFILTIFILFYNINLFNDLKLNVLGLYKNDSFVLDKNIKIGLYNFKSLYKQINKTEIKNSEYVLI